MKSNTISLNNPSNVRLNYRWLDLIAKKAFISKFKALKFGCVIVKEGIYEYTFGDETGLQVVIDVHEPSFYSDVIFGGTVGAGEAYMGDSWSCDQLTDLVRIIVRNEAVLQSLDGGFGNLMMPFHKLFHFLHRNTLKGSRRNISSHYDLGNDMFEQFLDPTMMYSSGIFETHNATMQQASLTKLDRICQKLALSENDHLLEIGTGWGGFAIHAAKNYGCKVTTTTISHAQYNYAKRRIEEEGLTDQITLLCEDYRDLTGIYDKLVSIEMIEAVGHPYYKNYFETCSKLLKPNGMMLIQSITIADQRYKQAKKEVDFIQRYIFPGGCLPSVNVLADNVTSHTDMRFYHLEDIGQHYATTLSRWRERFFSNLHHIKNLGYSDSFCRMWDFYLCYCEGGFKESSIGTVQLLLVKPEYNSELAISPQAKAIC